MLAGHTQGKDHLSGVGRYETSRRCDALGGRGAKERWTQQQPRRRGTHAWPDADADDDDDDDDNNNDDDDNDNNSENNNDDNNDDNDDNDDDETSLGAATRQTG